MSTAVQAQHASNGVPASIQETALLGGDLSKLTVSERLSYYNGICTSLGLNPLTRPFEYIVLNNKLTLYARKDCTEQLRSLREISVQIVSREVVEGVYVVTARASMPTPHGIRADESIGAVPIANVQGEARANAMMKGETKAKRRVTLSICGLGMLDESETDSIPSARIVPEDISPDEVAAKQTAVRAAVQAKLEAKQAQPPTQAPKTSPAPVAAQAGPFIWRTGKEPAQGGHKGQAVDTIDLEYLRWYVANGKIADHVAAAKAELGRVACSAATNSPPLSGICEAYIEQIGLCETVTECRTCTAQALTDINISLFENKQVEEAGNKRLAFLRG